VSQAYRLTSRDWASNILRVAARYIGYALAAAASMFVAGGFAALFRHNALMGLLAATVVGLALLVVAAKLMLRRDELAEIITRVKAHSKLTTRGEYVEGLELIPVALSLTSETFHYDNADLEASFDLHRIEEIEYDDEVTTGTAIPYDARVLRLRSHGATFEFVIPKYEAAKWAAALPARSLASDEEKRRA